MYGESLGNGIANVKLYSASRTSTPSHYPTVWVS